MTDGKRQPPEAPEGSDAGAEREQLLQLASVVAHQLKSPLSSVQTVLSSLLVLNRMDMALISAPLLLSMCLHSNWRTSIGTVGFARRLRAQRVLHGGHAGT